MVFLSQGLLTKNEIPTKPIDKSVKKYISKKIMNMPSETEPSKNKKNMILQIAFHR